MPNKEITYKSWKYRNAINEFRDYLLFRLLTKEIRNNDDLYNEYSYLIKKYEEHFQLDDLQ